MSRYIDGDNLMMSLTDWWYSSFGEKETQESKAIHEVLNLVEEAIKAMPPVQPEVRTEMSSADCISRQAAIDAFFTATSDGDKAEWCEYVIKTLPSVQPEVRTEMSSADCIRRQAAIDAIDTWNKFGIDERCRIVKWYEGLEPYVHLRDVVLAIVNLPSARPEIVRCRDCLMHGVCRFEHGLGLNGYCSQGKREKV